MCLSETIRIYPDWGWQIPYIEGACHEVESPIDNLHLNSERPHMDNPVRLGFIGAGHHARSMLYPSLHFVPQVHLTAIATQTEASAARAQSDFRVRCHIGYENLLADDEIEAVIISVPGKRAAEISAAALQAGKHVLCETPAITSAEDTVRISRALADHPHVYQVAFCLRYAPIYRKLRTLLSAWRQEGSGGFCLDIRYYEWIHHFYNMALYLCGNVNEVKAWGQGKSRRIVLIFENGDLGTIRSTAFRNHAIPYEEVEITRDDGMLRATDRLQLQYFREPDILSSQDMAFDSAGGTVWRNSTSVPYNRLNTLYASGYAAEIEDFAACVRGTRAPLSSLDDAAKTDALRRAVEAAVQA
ncbi:MAG: Gfo/Idh/MocA family oxidoreductase [bacterium]|nr:Gfo/Idh/MocA family oxidoreductase [bacterium]